ncbi:MAG: hypothetical protein JWO95_3360 [Verrucomicrobiales bacterium]|nr:hypothetical protein [Verrucomicrobiales bacterium]
MTDCSFGTTRKERWLVSLVVSFKLIDRVFPPAQPFVVTGSAKRSCWRSRASVVGGRLERMAIPFASLVARKSFGRLLIHVFKLSLPSRVPVVL